MYISRGLKFRRGLRTGRSKALKRSKRHRRIHVRQSNGSSGFLIGVLVTLGASAVFRAMRKLPDSGGW